MIKNECKIIRDLLPNYLEDLTSKETSEFIEKHMKTCKDCKDILKMLKGDKEEEEQKEEKSEEEEIKLIKKYNREMLILKIFAGMLALFILITWPILFIKKTKEKKHNEEVEARGKYIHEIILAANNKLEELEKENNLEEIIEETCLSRENETKTNYIYKYKDEKMCGKIISNIEFEDEEVTSIYTGYGILLENEQKVLRIRVDGENVYEEAYIYFNLSSERELANLVMNGLLYKDIVECSIMELREEEYNGKVCYVIKDATETYGLEIWIEKETNLILQTIDQWGAGGNITQREYTWNVGTVTDEDIFDGYTEEEISERIINAPKQIIFPG